MSLSPLNKLKRNLSLHLTLWYAVVSFASYIVIFSLAYYSLSASLEREDKREIELKFQRYNEAYKDDELSGLQELIDMERVADKPFIYFVRIADSQNTTLLLNLPDEWRVLDTSTIANISLSTKPQKITLKSLDKVSVFEVTTFSLSDGNFLQIGKDISQRESLLGMFSNVFIAVALAAFVISLLVGYMLTFRAIKPIRHLTNTVQTIVNTADTSARVSYSQTEDEIGKLIALFNTMLERIETLITVMKDSLDMVAHDLRTPMTRLRGIAENALLSKQDIDSYKEALSDCLEESERLLGMLNTLMDISEAKAGTLTLKKEPLDIIKLVQEIVEVYRYVAEQKGVKLTFEAEIKDAVLSVDQSRMRQVVGNLLDNAIKFTNSEGIVLVKIFRREQDKIVIEVSDSGIGIDEQDLPKIWDRLYRAEKSRTERGMGLGLSLVKSIVELHGGVVGVRSKLGVGTSFSVYL